MLTLKNQRQMSSIHNTYLQTEQKGCVHGMWVLSTLIPPPRKCRMANLLVPCHATSGVFFPMPSTKNKLILIKMENKSYSVVEFC